jgi:hypothetical protein
MLDHQSENHRKASKANSVYCAAVFDWRTLTQPAWISPTAIALPHYCRRSEDVEDEIVEGTFFGLAGDACLNIAVCDLRSEDIYGPGQKER